MLGNRDTKRTLYFEKAALCEEVPFLFVDWRQWSINEFSERSSTLFLKVDPPIWQSGDLTKLEQLTSSYQDQLLLLEANWKGAFFNTPKAILTLLDKRKCKSILQEAGLCVTEEVDLYAKESTKSLGGQKIPIRTMKDLLDRMEEHHVYQVFLKPIYGSGAAGVTALRIQPKTGKIAVYTCACLLPEKGRLHFINTKKLQVIRDRKEAEQFLSYLLSLKCVVEHWYPKAEFGEYSYDLRAVVQEGQVDFVLARLSKGPITNLHLNNRPMDGACLGLPSSVKNAITKICLQAAESVPGLRSVGIDILLERGSLNPRIIEMNAQGDLLYQDIYRENKIYRHQAAIIKHWLLT